MLSINPPLYYCFVVNPSLINHLDLKKNLSLKNHTLTMNILVKICTHFQTKKHTLFRGVGANFLKICHKGVPPFLPLPSSNLSHDPYHRSTSHTPLTKLRTEELNHRNMNPIPTSSVFLSQSHRVSGILLSG